MPACKRKLFRSCFPAFSLVFVVLCSITPAIYMGILLLCIGYMGCICLRVFAMLSCGGPNSCASVLPWGRAWTRQWLRWMQKRLGLLTLLALVNWRSRMDQIRRTSMEYLDFSQYLLWFRAILRQGVVAKMRRNI